MEHEIFAIQLTPTHWELGCYTLRVCSCTAVKDAGFDGIQNKTCGSCWLWANLFHKSNLLSSWDEQPVPTEEIICALGALWKREGKHHLHWFYSTYSIPKFIACSLSVSSDNAKVASGQLVTHLCVRTCVCSTLGCCFFSLLLIQAAVAATRLYPETKHSRGKLKPAPMPD